MMVLENCEACMNYWISHGRDMYGYRLLTRDQHIPEAHLTDNSSDGSGRSGISRIGRRKGGGGGVFRARRRGRWFGGGGFRHEGPPPPALVIEGDGRNTQCATQGRTFEPHDRWEPEVRIFTACSDNGIEVEDNISIAGADADDEKKEEIKKEKEGEKEVEKEEKKADRPARRGFSGLPRFRRATSSPGACERTEFKDKIGFTDAGDDMKEGSEEEEENKEKNEDNVDNFQENYENHNVKLDMEIEHTDTKWYTPLYKAARNGDWESAKSIFHHHGHEMVVARIRGGSETALHIAAGCGSGTTSFLKELVSYISPKYLEVTNNEGCTPLAIAAKVGNLEAAKLLVYMNPNLLYIPDNNERFPIHNAAEYGHKDMLLYLLEVTQQGQRPDPYDLKGRGPELLRLIIKAGFYDAALLLLGRMPELATSGIYSNQSLHILAENPCAFSCGGNMGALQPLIYACVPRIQEKQPYLRHTTRDIEGGASEKNISYKSHPCGQIYFLSGLQKIHQVLWGIFETIVPLLKDIKSEKLKRHQAKKLVKALCREAANNLNEHSDAALLFKMPLLMAAENGIHEIVKEITNSFPDAIWYRDGNNSEVFRLAIEKRHHKVYNLLCEMDDLYINIVRQSLENGDNILHLAANLAPSDRLRVVSGAALQMQRELQWFKEIKSLVQPAYRSMRDKCGNTPQEIFSQSHQALMEEGEKWMRDTATSYTVVAALIATVVFAAAITVPGGNDGGSGKPMLGSEKAFIIFGVADALSLFTSSASILMFLSILTCRYAEDDFLRALPSRLIIGLLTLFVSIASMMAAFSSTLYLMFGYENRWILGAVIAPSCLLVAIFASMHISLLAEMINSTYLCGIFKKRSKSKKPICFKKGINI